MIRIVPCCRALASAFALLVALPLAGAGLAQPAKAVEGKPPESAGPYVPTPWAIVDEIMKLAQIGPGDFVVDLGSGDGRLVIAAAKKYGARGGFGVDIEPSLVEAANATANKEGLGERVRFYVRDLFETPVGEASVVTLYLLPTSVPKLEPKLLAELPAGARVVSHDYGFPNWPHERFVKMDVPEKIPISGTPRTTLYLYIVPARVAGEWELTLPSKLAPAPLALAIAQTPAGASGTLGLPSRSAPLKSLLVKGREVTLTLPPLGPAAKPLTLRGRAGDGTMEGALEDGSAWRAVRRS
jgi:hypothetical protein